MEKRLQELCLAHFFGCPYCSNGTKIHLDVALHECFTETLSRSFISGLVVQKAL